MGHSTATTKNGFNSRLTPADEKNFKAFRTLLALDDIEVFSSDDFRRYGLDRFVADPQHGIGAFFGKLKVNGLAEPVGHMASEITSNNRRENKTYRFTIKGKTYLVNVKQESLAVGVSP